MTAILWDPAARHATIEQCATVGHRASFDDWWLTVTRRPWTSSRHRPVYVAARTRTSGCGGHGIGSSDYGGGHYGDFGGGHSGGYSFGGSF